MKYFFYFYKKDNHGHPIKEIQFIQEFLKYANANMLDKLEELLKQERSKEFEKEIHPITLEEYENRMLKAFDDVQNNRVKSARTLKNEISIILA